MLWHIEPCSETAQCSRNGVIDNIFLCTLHDMVYCATLMLQDPISLCNSIILIQLTSSSDIVILIIIYFLKRLNKLGA